MTEGSDLKNNREEMQTNKTVGDVPTETAASPESCPSSPEQGSLKMALSPATERLGDEDSRSSTNEGLSEEPSLTCHKQVDEGMVDSKIPASSSPDKADGERNVIQTAKQGRFLIDGDQQTFLNEFYVTSPYPSRDQYSKLAKSTKLSIKTIKQWFQNKRSKDRKMPKSAQSDHETASSYMASIPFDPTMTTCNNTFISDDEKSNSSLPSKCDDPTQSGLDSGITESKYQQMTQVSLPPDHPFCRLVAATENPILRRPIRRGSRHSSNGDQASTPVARPPYARQRSRAQKRKEQEVLRSAASSKLPENTSTNAQSKSILWRPVNLPGAPKSENIHPGRTESPLDLSVNLKKRKLSHDENDENDCDSPEPMPKLPRASSDLPEGKYQPQLIPIGYSGGPVYGDFGLYGHFGHGFVPIMATSGTQMPYRIPAQVPYGYYGQAQIVPQTMPKFATNVPAGKL